MEERMNRKDVSFGTFKDLEKQDKEYWATPQMKRSLQQ
jgi:hypothetical protein